MILKPNPIKKFPCQTAFGRTYTFVLVSKNKPSAPEATILNIESGKANSCLPVKAKAACMASVPNPTIPQTLDQILAERRCNSTLR